MKFLTTAEYGLVALLLLSLAGKLATNRQDRDSRTFERTLASAVVQEFSRARFTTKVEEWPSGVAVHAERGACRMWVRESSPHGTMRNVHEELATSVGSLRYIYRGESFKEPPTLDPMLWFFFDREMARLGITVSRYPLYAVASSKACDPSLVRWPVAIG